MATGLVAGPCESGKKGFRTPGQATAAMYYIRRQPRFRGKLPRRVYECKCCGQYHLTSRTGKPRGKY